MPVNSLYGFASDNTSGMCPEALDAISEANRDNCPSYGDDPWTARAADAFRELFATDCDVYFVFNGTAANSLALAALCQSYHSVIVGATGHVDTDECGAPEFFSNGTKLIVTATRDGKLVLDDVRHHITRRTDIHYPKPHAISVTQSTELGTVYTTTELKQVCALAREHNLRVHMDGARLANAIAALDCTPADITWRAGIDVVCFGGTKNGIGTGEAVVFFDRSLSEEFAYRCKQAGQLASKMRFLAAPWARALDSGCWLTNARHANAMAARLERAATMSPKVSLAHPREANEVFLLLPESAHAKLSALGWVYYRFIGGGARLVCAWNTSESDVDQLARDIVECSA